MTKFGPIRRNPWSEKAKCSVQDPRMAISSCTHQRGKLEKSESRDFINNLFLTRAESGSSFDPTMKRQSFVKIAFRFRG